MFGDNCSCVCVAYAGDTISSIRYPSSERRIDEVKHRIDLLIREERPMAPPWAAP